MLSYFSFVASEKCLHGSENKSLHSLHFFPSLKFNHWQIIRRLVVALYYIWLLHTTVAPNTLGWMVDIYLSRAPMLFVELSCHWPELDGFDWHYQASVHCSKQCRKITQQHQDKKLSGMRRIKPRAGRWEASKLPLCYAAPPWIPTLFCLTK